MPWWAMTRVDETGAVAATVAIDVVVAADVLVPLPPIL